MTLLKTLTTLVFACLTGGSATAATLAGVTLPDTVKVGSQTLVLNGMGVRTLTVFDVRVYVAALYLPQRSSDAQAILRSPDPKVLMLHFVHSGSKAEIEKEYRKGEEVNCAAGGCDPADAADFERLVTVAPAVKEGDTSTYVFANNGVDVQANGRSIDKIANPDLARRLLAGFIGDHPPSTVLRGALLGLPPS